MASHTQHISSIFCVCLKKGKQRPDKKSNLLENLLTQRRFLRQPGGNIDATGSITEGCLNEVKWQKSKLRKGILKSMFIPQNISCQYFNLNRQNEVIFSFFHFYKKNWKNEKIKQGNEVMPLFQFSFFVENRKIRKMSKNTVWIIKSYFQKFK